MARRFQELGIPQPEKVDVVAVGKILGAMERRDPPLVAKEFSPADQDQFGRAIPGAQHVWELTPAGSDEMARLERLIGVS
jgi:hypothetical protein